MTLLALASLPSKSGQSTLDQLISRNLRQRQIIPIQEGILTHAIELLKETIPKRFAITTLSTPIPETWGLKDAINRAFARNGINADSAFQTASSPKETGIMFTMPNPRNPPEFAFRLKDAFEIAGIREIQFVNMRSDVAVLYDFTIFIGPAALK